MNKIGRSVGIVKKIVSIYNRDTGGDCFILVTFKKYG